MFEFAKAYQADALRRLAIAFTVAILSPAAGSAWAAGPETAAPLSGQLQATYDGQIPAAHTIDLERPDRSHLMLVVDGADIAALTSAQKGDLLTAAVDNVFAPTAVTGIVKIQRPLGVETRLLALAAPLFLLLGAAAAVTRWRPQQFLLGVDGLYSNSQVQLAIWFGCVAIVYGATWILRTSMLNEAYAGGIAITPNLLGLSGLSAISFGGAKVLAASKNAAVAARAALLQAQVVAVDAGQAPPQPRKPNILVDLVTTGLGAPDLGDFQMMLITVVAAATYLVIGWNWLGLLDVTPTTTLPDVDTALLASFGVGQGAYLFKKGAMPPAAG